MEQFVTRTIEALIFPPGIFLVLLVVVILLLNKKPIFAKPVLYVVVITLYLLSTPFVAGLLISHVETYPALEDKELKKSIAGAIVVLAGGHEKNAKEYGGDTVGSHTLLRCRYGAYLQRKTGVPIWVSGGWVLDNEGKSEAQVMAELLREDFQAGEVWLEDQSRATGENAFFTNKFLEKKQVDTVFLVTQAWHMPRSVVAFERVGINVIPAPTAFEGGTPFTLLDALPSTNALNISRFAMHEMVGAIWYMVRY